MTKSRSRNNIEDSFRKMAVLSPKFTQSRKLSGTELLPNYVSAYQYATYDMVLTEEDNLNYLHDCFYDDALIFYQIEIEGIYFKLDDALKRIKRTFKPISTQQHTYRELRAFRTEMFEENTTSPAKALNNLNYYILSHAQLVPLHHRNEASKLSL